MALVSELLYSSSMKKICKYTVAKGLYFVYTMERIYGTSMDGCIDIHPTHAVV